MLRLLHQPELAKGTSLESQFVRLSKRKELLPKQIRCVVFDSKAEAYLWIRLEHDVGWGGEATVPWTRVARLRAAADQGENPPAHDALEFVMAQAVLDDDLNERLAGHDFPVSTLERLLKSENVRTELGLSFGSDHLQGKYDKNWTLAVLLEIIRAIGNAEFDGEPFSVRTINTVSQQKVFVEKLLENIPRPKGVFKEWPLFADTEMSEQSPAQPAIGPTASIPKSSCQKNRAKEQPSLNRSKHLVDGRSPVKPPIGRANDILWSQEARH